MSMLVTTGASLACSFGTLPSNLVVTSQMMTQVNGQPVATIQDGAPLTNVAGFGMCSSLANPAVASATAAALGVLTPQPCVPATAAWIPSQVGVTAGGLPCLTQDCKLQCAYLGTISVVSPNQVSVMTE